MHHAWLQTERDRTDAQIYRGSWAGVGEGSVVCVEKTYRRVLSALARGKSDEKDRRLAITEGADLKRTG